MIRLFIAVEIGPQARMCLQGIGSGLPGARPVPDEQRHITLRFIGEVDRGLFHDIKEGLSSLEAAPFELAVQGVGHFPPRGQPRVLWAGLAGTADLLILRNKINHQLFLNGIQPDQRKFHPHITLARLKNCPLPRVIRFLTAHNDLSSPPWQVSEVCLFSSILTKQGAHHQLEATYPLEKPTSKR